jgi:hypothetical protein
MRRWFEILRLGERTKAAEYYRKALARHPSDHLAKDGLARVTEKDSG